ncbi:hypothetical protein BV898_17804 [Hypsibius exemplaris]|uniref:Uncharacterized protein n=1 Tax=Hypsibius exemplaris TaxID=2072580 RepID=A0A9X6NIN6_HYPEX|nr:hypothetical protein BV898_17804 [Hypsibius exemplaris]
MDGFIFYILLVVITALASMLCSCLWKNYRNRAFQQWQQQQLQQQQFLASAIQQQNNSNHPLVIGIFQGPSDLPFVIRPNNDAGAVPVVPAAPPAYTEVVSHPEIYPKHTQAAVVVDGEVSSSKSAEELPPPYSDLRH